MLIVVALPTNTPNEPLPIIILSHLVLLPAGIDTCPDHDQALLLIPPNNALLRFRGAQRGVLGQLRPPAGRLVARAERYGRERVRVREDARQPGDLRQPAPLTLAIAAARRGARPTAGATTAGAAASGHMWRGVAMFARIRDIEDVQRALVARASEQAARRAEAEVVDVREVHAPADLADRGAVGRAVHADDGSLGKYEYDAYLDEHVGYLVKEDGALPCR